MPVFAHGFRGSIKKAGIEAPSPACPHMAAGDRQEASEPAWLQAWQAPGVLASLKTPPAGTIASPRGHACETSGIRPRELPRRFGGWPGISAFTRVRARRHPCPVCPRAGLNHDAVNSSRSLHVRTCKERKTGINYGRWDLRFRQGPFVTLKERACECVPARPRRNGQPNRIAPRLCPRASPRCAPEASVSGTARRRMKWEALLLEPARRNLCRTSGPRGFLLQQSPVHPYR